MRLPKALLALLAWALVSQLAQAAPERLAGITYPFRDQGEFWVNSEPLADSDLRGRPVLVMFWTYSCYNCTNSIAWINEVHRRYADRGLLVLGIHTPEFEFERDRERVSEKTAEHGIEFPVMLDNDYVFWRDMRNSWWPAFYLADKRGNIKAELIGETHLGTDKSERFLALLEREL